MSSINLAEFTVPYLQILDEKGQIDKKLDPNLSAEKLLKIYRYMRLARMADERMLKMQRQGRIGTFAPCTGQEAVSVAAAIAMGKEDWFAGAFRELGGRMVMGEKVADQLLYYNGYEEGNVMPEETGGRLLPISVIIGPQLLHATGIAYAMKYRQEQNAVLTFVGDGGTSEGDFHEALNFASVWKAPVVFINQNNGWAISIPRDKQTNSRTLAQKGIAYDIPCIQIDGNDALAVYSAVTDALDRAYRGEGPTLIEAVTYRLMMHTTADDARKYRPESEENEAWAKEPLIRFRKYLTDKKLWDDSKEEALIEELKSEIEASVQEFESRTDFPIEAPFDYVYGTEEPEILRQKEAFLAELKKEASDA